MRSFNVMLIVFFLLLLVIGGCSSYESKQPHVMKKEMYGDRIFKAITIKARGSYEECIELSPGMVFDYDYSSSDFVDFNIHYHGEDRVYYPVSRNGYRMGRGVIDPDEHDFYIKEQENYCLMWDNPGSEKVRVSFTCTLRQKKPGMGMGMDHN